MCKNIAKLKIDKVVWSPGIFLYASFTINAGYLSKDALEPPILVIVNSVVEVIQGNLVAKPEKTSYLHMEKSSRQICAVFVQQV